MVNVFWFLTGMLTMLAVLIIILPWLRTVPRFDSLPTLPWQAPLVGIVVIGAAVGLYAWTGRPELVASVTGVTPPAAALRAMPPSTAPAGTKAAPGSMNTAIDSLRARLGKGAGSNDEWELLAKSYDFIGQPAAAREARAHRLPAAPDAATPLTPPAAAAAAPAALTVATPPLSPDSLKQLNAAARARHDKQYAAAAKIYKQLAAARQMNADAWADYADTAATLRGNKLAGEPETYIANALALDADHPKALWLKASADEEAGRFNAAIGDWQRLQAMLPPDSADAKIVAANLQRDREAVTDAGAGGPGGPGGIAPTAAPTATADSSVSGEVSISNTLADKATAGATLFIVAKSVDAPGPPVAVYRGSVSAWPVAFTLDDSLSMLPGRNLTNTKHVTVEARVSRSGQAQPAAGDLRGKTAVIDLPNHQPLKILINEVVL